MPDVIRNLSFEERAKFGACPDCHARHGEACDARVGIPLELTTSGSPPSIGAHLVRLNHSPRRVHEVEPS